MSNADTVRRAALVLATITALCLVGCPPEQVKVPDVVEVSQAQAEMVLISAGLTLGEISEAYHATIPVGGVISQTPAAGSSVAAGTAVDLVVSKGPAPVNVPNVVGMTQTAAQSAITSAGLTVGAVTQQYSGTVPTGQVISQNPSAGSSVAPGSAVGLVVSKGPAPVNVPNVVGMTQSAAQAAITGAGLTVGTVTEEHSSTAPVGQVISQNPAAGASVASGTAVALTVSKGLAPVGPTAAFTATPLGGAVPLAVEFTDTSTAGSQPITSWSWDFGDGAISQEQHPTHVYEAVGLYTASLTVATAVGEDAETRTDLVTAYEGISAVVEDTVVVPEQTDGLSAVEVQDDAVVLEYVGTGSAPVSAGSILVSGEGDGYLRRVIEVTQTGGTIIAATEPAALTDVIEQADITASGTFTAEDFEKAGIAPEKDGTVFVRLSNVRVFGNASSTVDYNGGVSFAPSVTVDLRVKDNAIEYFKFAASGQLYIEFDIAFAASGTLGISYERSVFQLLGTSKPTKVLVVWAGYVPIVVLIEFDLLVGGQVSGAGAASFTTGFDSTTTIQVGAEYADSAWANVSGVSLGANLHAPVWNVSAAFDGRFFLKPKLTAKLYALTGPSIAAKPYAGFKVQPFPAPLKASFGVGIDGDLAFNLIDLSTFGVGFAVGYNYGLQGPYYPLWSYTAPQAVLSVAPAQRDVTSSAGSTSFSVSNTGTGTMNWTASVTSGSSWMRITSGSSGANSGTINVGYDANASTSSRTGTIQVAASGATGSPKTVNVVQAGTAPQPILSVTPSQRDVSAASGTTTFSVSNTGTGTMNWTASVTSGSSWMRITSGSSGANSGTINVGYDANASTSSRTGTIQVAAAGAIGSPMTVSVVQAGTGGTDEIVILDQPDSLVVCGGDDVTFTVSCAGGVPPYSYQWYWNYGEGSIFLDDGSHPSGSGAVLTGTKSATLTLTDVGESILFDGPSDRGEYNVVVDDSSVLYQPAASAWAQLNFGMPIIVSQPTDVSEFPGANPAMSVVVVDNSGLPLHYQWEYNLNDVWHPVVDDPFPPNGVSGSSTSYLCFFDIQLPGPSTVEGMYRVRIMNYGGCEESVVSRAARLQIFPAPTIIEHPQSVTKYPHNTHVMNVSATGFAMNYEWSYAPEIAPGTPGTFVSIANSGTLPAAFTNYVLNSLTPALFFTDIDVIHEGYYRCRVSNLTGTVTSNAARLGVERAPEITKQPESLTVPSGFTTTFTLTATGNNITYEWLVTQTPSDPGSWVTRAVQAGNPNLVITNAQAGPYPAGDEGYYRCDVSAGGYVVPSNVVTLEVTDPGILDQPNPRTVNPGGSFSSPLSPAFEVTATSAYPPLKYTWYHDGGVNPPEVVGTPNSPNPYMLLSNIQEEDEGNYYVVVSNSDTPAGSTASESAFLDVNDSPVIITEPQDILTDLGTGIQLSVTAHCDFIMTFQWSFQPLDESLPMEPILDSDGGRKSGYLVTTSPGEQKVVFEIFPTVIADEGYYQVTLNSPGIGDVTSNRVKVLLGQALSIDGYTPTSDVNLYVNTTWHRRSVTTSGGLGIRHYQWLVDRGDGNGFVNAQSVVNSTADPFTAPLHIFNVQFSDAGVYRCDISDERPPVLSSPELRLGVYARLGQVVLAEGGASVTAYENEPYTLSADVSGGIPPLTFEWLKTDPILKAEVALAVTSTGTLLLDPIEMTDAGVYRLRVSDSGTDVKTSNYVRIEVE